MIGLSRQYQAALRKYLKQGPRSGSRLAKMVGSRAVAIGLETLDLARIHEHAVRILILPGGDARTLDAIIPRAGLFFTEVITPLEQTHRTARKTNAYLRRMNDALRRRTEDLALSNQQLKEEIIQRKSAEESLKQSERHYARLLEQSRQMQDQLRLLSRELLSAQEEERKKISRELHDVIAQTLAGINVRLAALKKAAAFNTADLESNIARTQLLVQQSVEIVHRFAGELRPTVLDDLGLIPALHTFMKSFKEQTGIHVSLSVFAEVEKVNGDKRTVLYRVTQEALTNVARHALASEAEVKIWKVDGEICLTVKDNGKGFPAEHVSHTRKRKRLGLLGMRERVEMVNGKLNVESAEGKGTTIHARIPVENSRKSTSRGAKLGNGIH
jgi:signal transduction histidine kinase